MDYQKETDARLVIDDLLRKADSADGFCRIYFGALGIFQTPSENLAVAIWHTSSLPGGWADGR